MKTTGNRHVLILIMTVSGILAIPTSAQAEYVDGMNFYEYVGSAPVVNVDPMGMWKYADPPSIRSRKSRAVMIAEKGDTIQSLANTIKLDAKEAGTWLRIRGRMPGLSASRGGHFITPEEAGWGDKKNWKVCPDQEVSVPNKALVFANNIHFTTFGNIAPWDRQSNKMAVGDAFELWHYYHKQGYSASVYFKRNRLGGPRFWHQFASVYKGYTEEETLGKIEMFGNDIIALGFVSHGSGERVYGVTAFNSKGNLGIILPFEIYLPFSPHRTPLKHKVSEIILKSCYARRQKCYKQLVAPGGTIHHSETVVFVGRPFKSQLDSEFVK